MSAGLSIKRIRLLVAGLLLLGLLAGTVTFAGGDRAPGAQEPVTAQGVASFTPLLNYQARLVNPATGNPKADSVYHIFFRIYDVDTGGTPLWEESLDVTVQRGLFNVLLGESTALDTGIFDGRDLWLGVQVETDPEATPRQRIGAAAYAIFSDRAYTAGWADDAYNADVLDGLDSSDFAPAVHDHDDRYYTESEADGQFVDVAGDTMTGVLNVPAVVYTSPHTQYYSVIGDVFRPRTDEGGVTYRSGYGGGGAYITAGSEGGMLASVNLPHGAVVTGLQVFFEDNVAEDLSVELEGYNPSGSYFDLATVTSAGISGVGNNSTTSINNATIDNSVHMYQLFAFNSNWSTHGGNLTVRGAIITYTINEPQ